MTERCTVQHFEWVTLLERLPKLIHPPLDGRPAIDRRGGLDRRMPHLRLDHIKRHLPGNRPSAKGVTQPVRRRPRQSFSLIGRQAGGPHRLCQPALDMLVERLVAHRLHRIHRAGEQASRRAGAQ